MDWLVATVVVLLLAGVFFPGMYALEQWILRRRAKSYKPNYPVIDYRNKQLSSLLELKKFDKIYIGTQQEHEWENGTIGLGRGITFTTNCLSLEEIFELYAEWRGDKAERFFRRGK